MSSDLTEHQDVKDNCHKIRRSPTAPRDSGPRGAAGGGGKVCGVCGDKALAQNFGALTCETCKAFFRRNALKQEGLARCLFENNCVIDRTTRRQCSACRLKKCFSIGMKPQLILDDDAKKARMTLRQKKKAEREGTSQPDPESSTPQTMRPGDSNIRSVISSSADVYMTDDDNSGSPIEAATFVSDAMDCATSLVNLTVSSSTNSVAHNPDDASSFTNTTEMTRTFSSMPTFPADTTFSPAMALSLSSDADFSTGAATLCQGPEPMDAAAAVDLFFQQTLAGLEPRSRDVMSHSGAPVAVELWATPSVAVQNWTSCWPLSHNVDSQQGTVSAEISAATAWHAYPSSLQDGLSNESQNAQRPRPAVISFQHVPREHLPSDMNMYWQLTKQERAILTLVSSTYQDTMMKLTNRDPQKTRGADLTGPSSDSSVSMQDYFYIMDQTLHLSVRFAKALPDFRELKQSDQITLLKASSMQCYGVATAAMCVPERGIWVTAFGDVGKTHLPAAIQSGTFVAEVFDFCAGLKAVAKTDLTIYGLLHCILLFEPREATVEDKRLVNTFKDKYITLLKHYLESEFSYIYSDMYFGTILENLGKLRMLGPQAVAFYKRFSAYFTPLGAEFFTSG